MTRLTFLMLMMGVVLFGAAPSALAQGTTPVHELQQVAGWQSANTNLAPAGAHEGVVYLCGETALEAWTDAGQLLWRQPLAEPCHFRPRVSGSTLVSAGRDHLAAWRTSDGTLLWRYTPQGKVGVPKLTDDRVLFGDDSDLVALQLADGAPLWRFTIANGALIHYAPEVLGDTVYVGGGDGFLHGLDLASGVRRWVLDNKKQWQYLRQLIAHEDRLIAGGYKDDLYGIAADGSRVLWRYYSGNFINSQLIADGRAIFWSPTGWVIAIDVETGAEAWRTRTEVYFSGSPQNWGPVMAEIQNLGTILVVLDMRQRLHVLDSLSGEEVATLKLPFSPHNFVTPLGARRVLVASKAGLVVVFDLP